MKRRSRAAGEVELAEMDGPFVKISLRGRFWHERSVVLARVGNYLKQRIPVCHFHFLETFISGLIFCEVVVSDVTSVPVLQEILEVDVEDEKMLDDSPENF